MIEASLGLSHVRLMDWSPPTPVSPVGAVGAVPEEPEAVVAVVISVEGPGPAALTARICMRWFVPAVSRLMVWETVLCPESQMLLQHHQSLSYEGRSRYW